MAELLRRGPQPTSLPTPSDSSGDCCSPFSCSSVSAGPGRKILRPRLSGAGGEVAADWRRRRWRSGRASGCGGGAGGRGADEPRRSAAIWRRRTRAGGSATEWPSLARGGVRRRQSSRRPGRPSRPRGTGSCASASERLIQPDGRGGATATWTRFSPRAAPRPHPGGHPARPRGIDERKAPAGRRAALTWPGTRPGPSTPEGTHFRQALQRLEPARATLECQVPLDPDLIARLQDQLSAARRQAHRDRGPG